LLRGAFLRCGEHNIALPLALSDICSVMLQMTMRGRRLRFLPVALALAGSLAFAQAELPWNRSEGAEARSWQALAPSVVVACLPGSCEASVSPEVVSVGLGSVREPGLRIETRAKRGRNAGAKVFRSPS
ncbi:unnamed protein product, partial [Effrenium voratum]